MPHILLLGTEFNWMKQPSHPKPKHRPITLSLTYRKPYVPKTKSILQKQKIKIKKVISVPPKIKIKPIIPLKTAQPPLELNQLGRLKTPPLHKSISKTRTDCQTSKNWNAIDTADFKKA